MIYNDLIVNNKIFDQLRSNFKNNKIQNAYIFHGQEGVGKEAHAIEFFALINCKNPLDNLTACRECNSCTKLLSLQHELLNIILPLPRNKAINRNDSALKALNEKQIQSLTNQFNIKGNNPYYKIRLNKANTILINSIKEINKNIQLSIPTNKFRVHLILDAEKLCFPKTESANALLKILEEPAENNFFILIVSDLSKILDTIKSRSTTIFFSPITPEKHYKYLIDKKIDIENAEIISKLSFGNISHSIKIAYNFDDKMLKLHQIVISLFNDDLIKWKKEFLSIKEKNDVIEYCSLLLLILRDISNYNLTNDTKSIIFSNFKNYIIQINENNSIDIDQCSEIINNTINYINSNGYIHLMITGLFFELNYLLNNKELPIKQY
tara:strand:+ start:372 stop:1514 length:1143 start_codon:yes stop_codon:yes gene_type:complete